jgi:hypothetical protein
LGIDNQRHLALNHVLRSCSRTFTNFKLSGLADVYRVANSVAVHSRKFVFRAMNEIAHHEVVFQQHQRFSGDDVGC